MRISLVMQRRVALQYIMVVADTVTGLAFGYVPEIIDFIRRTNIISRIFRKHIDFFL